MRIAISGAHRVGKSTLVEALVDALPGYTSVDEPYHQLVEEGHDLAAMPSVEDFELMLKRSIACLRDSEPDVVLDRCPLDLLAYLRAHPDAGASDADPWLPAVRAALEALDLIVFVPIEEPDRIALPASEDPGFRLEVDEQLRQLVVDDSLGLERDVLEVSGPIGDRMRQILARVRG